MEIFERQDQESNRNYCLFLTYLQMNGSRSLSRLAAASGKSESHCRALSAQWNWCDRAKAYDNEQSKLQLEAIKAAHLAEIAAHRDRSKLIAQQQLDAGHRFLTLALERLNSMTSDDLADLTGCEIASAMKAVSVMSGQAMTAMGQSLTIGELLNAIKQTNPDLLT